MIPRINVSQLWFQVLKCYQMPYYKHTRILGINHNTKPSTIFEDLQVITTLFVKSEVLEWVDSVSQKNLVSAFIGYCPECWSESLCIVHPSCECVCTGCGFVVRDQIIDDGIVDPNGWAGIHQKQIKSKHGSTPLPRQHTLNWQKRQNHFQFWLRRIQGKERVKMSQTEIIRVQDYITSHKVNNINYDKMKGVLKTLGYSNHYHHIFYLIRFICGKPLVDLTVYHEEKLLEMFALIQVPFSQLDPPRINMLNYTFLLRKFCELLNWIPLAKNLPQLKSWKKIRSQDKIWKDLCKTCQLRFIPTRMET